MITKVNTPQTTVVDMLSASSTTLPSKIVEDYSSTIASDLTLDTMMDQVEGGGVAMNVSSFLM